METLERVFHSVEKENKKNEKLIKKSNYLVFNDDEEHNNRVMDLIIEFKEVINKVNDGYLRLHDVLQDIYEIDVKQTSDEDRSFLDQLIVVLNKMNRQTARFYSELSKEEFLRKGCKSDLLDLRINLRSMRETISDVEDKLIDSDEDVNELINDLLAQF